MTRPETMALYLSLAAYVANAREVACRLALDSDEPPFELVEAADCLDAAGDRMVLLLVGGCFHDQA